MDIGVVTKIIKKGDGDSLKKALYGLFDTDCDFMGENGVEYNWKEAKEYSSSCDYLVEKVMDDDKLVNEVEKVKSFIKEFIKHESDYYDFSYEIIDRDNEVIVSVATAHEY